MRATHAAVFDVLDAKNVSLFGENMAAVHSIEYGALGSYFYLFGGLCDSGSGDETLQRWLSWDEVVAIGGMLGIPTVPCVWRGACFDPNVLRWKLDALARQPSVFAEPEIPEAERVRPEGFVVRHATSFSSRDAHGSHSLKYEHRHHLQKNTKHKGCHV